MIGRAWGVPVDRANGQMNFSPTFFKRFKGCLLQRASFRTVCSRFDDFFREIIKRHRDAEKLNNTFYEDPKTGYLVRTRSSHLERGKCCGSACRHVSISDFQLFIKLNENSFSNACILLNNELCNAYYGTQHRSISNFTHQCSNFYSVPTTK